MTEAYRVEGPNKCRHCGKGFHTYQARNAHEGSCRRSKMDIFAVGHLYDDVERLNSQIIHKQEEIDDLILKRDEKLKEIDAKIQHTRRWIEERTKATAVQ